MHRIADRIFRLKNDASYLCTTFNDLICRPVTFYADHPLSSLFCVAITLLIVVVGNRFGYLTDPDEILFLVVTNAINFVVCVAILLGLASPTLQDCYRRSRIVKLALEGESCQWCELKYSVYLCLASMNFTLILFAVYCRFLALVIIYTLLTFTFVCHALANLRESRRANNELSYVPSYRYSSAQGVVIASDP